MNKQEFFIKVADTIDKFGHVQHSFGNSEYGYCVYGASRRVTDCDNWRVLPPPMLKWMIEFGDWLQPTIPYIEDYGMDERVTRWNDAEGRTKDEVVLNLRKFADEEA